MPARSAATARRLVPPAACGPTQACCWGPRTIFENTILACPSVARRGGAAASLFAQTRPLFKRKSTSPQTSLGVRRKLVFPCQRMAHDAFQVVEMRLPFEHSAGAVEIRHVSCASALPPLGHLDLEIEPRDAFDRVDHLEHGKAAAVTAIERDGGAARAQMGQGIGMRAHEVADVNIVADASAVWPRIIGAEDLDDRPQADRGFHCDLDEVSGSFGRLTDTRGGEMDNGLDLMLGDQGGDQRLVARVTDNKRRAVRYRPIETGCKIVEHHDALAGIEERVNHV